MKIKIKYRKLMQYLKPSGMTGILKINGIRMCILTEKLSLYDSTCSSYGMLW
jgi:hypothetical protein